MTASLSWKRVSIQLTQTHVLLGSAVALLLGGLSAVGQKGPGRVESGPF